MFFFLRVPSLFENSTTYGYSALILWFGTGGRTMRMLPWCQSGFVVGLLSVSHSMSVFDCHSMKQLRRRQVSVSGLNVSL